MSRESEILPSDSQLNLFVERLIVPMLRELSSETGHQLFLATSIMIGGETAKTLAVLSIGESEQACLNGALRLRFKEAFGNRTLLHCECIFRQDQAVKNCSGLSLRGELKDSEVKRLSWTIRYSVWNWTGWV
jgi:hypothetical protein